MAPICEPALPPASRVALLHAKAPGFAAVPGQISRASRIRALGVLPLPAPTIAAPRYVTNFVINLDSTTSSTSLRPSARTHTRLTLQIRLLSTRILLDSAAIVYSFVPGLTGSLAAPAPLLSPPNLHNSNFSAHTITTRLADTQSSLLKLYLPCHSSSPSALRSFQPSPVRLAGRSR